MQSHWLRVWAWGLRVRDSYSGFRDRGFGCADTSGEEEEWNKDRATEMSLPPVSDRHLRRRNDAFLHVGLDEVLRQVQVV